MESCPSSSPASNDDFYIRLDSKDKEKKALPLAYIQNIGFSGISGSLGIQLKVRWESWFSHQRQQQKRRSKGHIANLFTLGGNEFTQSHVCVQFGYDFDHEQAFLRLGPYWLKLPFFIQDALHYYGFPHRDNDLGRRWWWLRLQIRGVGPGQRPSVYVSTSPVSSPPKDNTTIDRPRSSYRSYYIHRSFPVPGPDSLLNQHDLSFFGALRNATIDSFPVSITRFQVWHNTGQIYPVPTDREIATRDAEISHPFQAWTSYDTSQMAAWNWDEAYELSPDVLMIPPTRYAANDKAGYVYITLQ